MRIENHLTTTLIGTWTQFKPLQQAALVGMVALALLLISLFWSGRPETMCTLLEGRELTPIETQRIQVALGKAGISDLEIGDHQVRVRKSELSRCLKAVSDANALPMDMAAGDEQPPAINMFMSRQQQELVLNFEKKRQIRDTLGKLPFVQQSWVQLDVKPRSSPLSRQQWSCVVSVRAANDRPLMAEQIRTIFQITQGSVAGIQSSEIVITDLTSGLALSADMLEPEKMAAVAQLQAERHENRVLEDEVVNALESLGAIAVHIETRSVSENLLEEPPSNESPKGLVQMNRAPTVSGTYAETNGRARVPTGLPEFTVTESEPKARSASWSNPTATKSIRVDIPEKVLAERLAGKYAAKVPSEAARLAVHELKEEAAGRVVSALRRHGFAKQDLMIDVVVDSFKPERPSLRSWSQFDEWMGGQSGLAVAILSGLVLCGVLGLSMMRKQPAKAPESEFGGVPAAQEVDEEIRAQIDRLIDRDPEAVAQVLREWIQKDPS